MVKKICDPITSTKFRPAIKLRATKLHLSQLVTSMDDKVWKHGWKLPKSYKQLERNLSNPADRSQIC